VRDAGDATFIDMDVTLTVNKKVVQLAMAVVAVKEGSAWKWVAIDFGAIGLIDDAFR
jgi:hypothetical protein